MNCVLIYRDLSKKEIRQVKELYLNGAAICISPLVPVPGDFKDITITHIYLDEEVKNKIANSAKEELLSYGNKIINGKSVKDWLSLQKTSLWYYHKHRIYLVLRNHMYTLREIKKYSEEYKQVHVFSHNTFQTSIPENTIHYYKKKTGQGITLKSKIIFCLSVIFKTFRGIFQRLNHGKRKHVIITNPNALGKYLNLETLNEDIEDLFLGYLRQKTDQSFIHIEDFLIPKPEGFQPKIQHKSTYTYPTLYAEYILFTRLIHMGNIMRIAKLHIKLKSIYQTLLSGPVSETENLIIRMLIQLNSSSLFYTYKLLAFQSYFKGKNYKTITAKDENSSSTRTILDAGKALHINTVGIQHGTISNLNINYMFTKEDTELHPMPHRTLVWGESSRSILINNGAYPKDSVITVGQIRTDIIPRLNRSKLNIKKPEQNNYDHTFLFASQPQPDPLLRKQAAEDVFKAFSKLNSALLIIKLHPREKDAGYYQNIAENIGCTNYVIESEMDLYKSIALCDGLITCYSTVGGEAVYFDKPLVILDHLKLDFCGYYKEGVAKRATNAQEIEKILEDMINNNFTVDPISYNSYIEKYAYKIDGNVSTRCLDYIRGLK